MNKKTEGKMENNKKHYNKFSNIDNLDNYVNVKFKFSICAIRKQYHLIDLIAHNSENLGRTWLLAVKFCFTFFFMLLFLILILPSINAGCCFDTTMGICSSNSQSASCTSLGGQYYTQACSSVDVCQMGCCVLGSNAEYSNSGRCELISRQRGFQENFQGGMTREDCLSLSQGQERGACVSGDIRPYECVFTTRQECPANFYPGLSCTSSALNTTCTTTSNTMCYMDSLYSKDSCGNPNTLIENCNFSMSKICEATSANSAHCRSLDCTGGKRNGESWCINLAGGGNVISGSSAEENNDGGIILSALVGSRYFKQYCLNGEIFTEGCSDFRQETCSTGEEGGQADCEVNPWAECLAANEAEADAVTGSTVDEDACDEDSCKVLELEARECYNQPDSWGGNTFCHEEEAGWVPTTGDSDNTERTSSEIRSLNPINDPTADLIRDLHLEKCVPKIAGGLQFYSSSFGGSGNSGSNAAASTCSAGSYTSTVKFENEGGNWYLIIPEQCDYYYNAGLLKNINADDFSDDNDCDRYLGLPYRNYRNSEDPSFHGFYSQSYLQSLWNGGGSLHAPINSRVVSYLNYRCKNLGDCDGKMNWAGVSGGETNSLEEMPCVKKEVSGNAVIECYFDFECKPFRAPTGDSNCEMCGQDGLPCSEYRCMSLGRGCEFSQPDDTSTGYCIASSDHGEPIISLQSITPPSPVPPYSAVQISINVNRIAYCKFNIGSAGTTYEDMQYSFDTNYSTQHSVRLYVPGQTNITSSNPSGGSSYPLISNGGNYQMYVRCEGTNGFWNLAATLIEFSVMEGPDTIILDPTDFSPVSGSKVMFNLTQKQISFKMDEPAECRWSEQDKDFDLMENSFSCGDSVTENSIVNGYPCSGTLINITTNLEMQSKYYIRCKDHPEYGADSIVNNGVTYPRNEHPQSIPYILRPSDALEISDITPAGITIMGTSNLTLMLEASTSDGAFDGRAICYWKHSNQSSFIGRQFTRFQTTDSSSHSQILNSPYIGMNYVQIKCEDSVGNRVITNSTFDLQIDTLPPLIARMYKDAGKLWLKTIEDAACYFSLDRNKKCSFGYGNATLMQGVQRTHTADWIDDSTFYIKCKDYRGNENTGECARIIRTY